MKLTMYPTSVEQPNRNESSGLQGKCLTPVKRNGDTYNGANCKNQSDPKYYHEWSNAEELLTGGQIQCGRPSTKHCSHQTYADIKGYRNTCPIAGINGTYTQPATLRLRFDINKKGITDTAKIKKVTLSFEHRCTGVDVGNGKEYITWGPNFAGGKKYPNYKPLTIQFAGQKQILESNPPLSWNFSNTGNFVFNNISYNNLANGYIDIIYGNNLETNPGNIYIRNLKIEIDYEDAQLYIEGYKSSDTLYIAAESACRTPIHYKIYVGYKQGTTKISPDKANQSPDFINSDTLRHLVKVDAPTNVSVAPTYSSNPQEKDIIRYTILDKSSQGGKKKITFRIQGTNKSISFIYEALARNIPKLTVPTKIERNTKANGIISLSATKGCTENIRVYDNDVSNLIYTFEEFDFDNDNNIIKQTDIDAFYEVLSQLSCGWHTLFFRRGTDKLPNLPSKKVQILPNNHKFQFIHPETNQPTNVYKTTQSKTSNNTLKIKYLGNPNLLKNPAFTIINSTHGKVENDIPTPEVYGKIMWGDPDSSDENQRVNKNGAEKTINIGRYYPGTYYITVQDADDTCTYNPIVLTVIIEPNHKQNFDEIFIRGEDSTSFNYDYLVAWIGDTVTKPIYVNTIELENSYDDIKVCASNNQKNIAGLTELKTIDFYITNQSSQEKDLKNVFLELNPLIKDDDGLYQATSQEWLNPDGIFYNFKENFDKYNDIYKNIVQIKNLTLDDDDIDEEDVYIHINEIKYEETIKLKIPYKSNVEKEVFLQVLLFNEPMSIYSTEDCGDTNLKTTLIPFKVYDSILTNMSIEGNTDIFETTILDCPKECYNIEEITYKIKNIDTSELKTNPTTIIENDPRLVPYKYIYKNQTYSLPETPIIGNKISFSINKKSYKTVLANGERLDVFVNFEGYEKIHLHRYTNQEGEATFFINIPKTLGGTYTIEKLLKYMSIEFAGSTTYQQANKTGEYYNDDLQETNQYYAKNVLTIEVPTNNIKYNAGQTIPVKVILKGQIQYLRNDIVFYPEIKQPRDEDKLIVYYKACNLPNNEGILKTKFKTDDYRLIPNEISKNIYCGVDTDLSLTTKLTKIVVQNKTINRLYLSLNNQKRENKNVVVTIKEDEIDDYDSIKNYKVLNYEIDNGIIYTNEDEIRWEIDYIKENSIITGYIDFKAKNIGYSNIKTTVEDFIHNQENEDNNNIPIFGKASYKCDCNRNREEYRI